jgi:hypothetical protein
MEKSGIERIAGAGGVYRLDFNRAGRIKAAVGQCRGSAFSEFRNDDPRLVANGVQTRNDIADA